MKSKQQKCWIGKVLLVEELFYYQYPFLLPDFFKQKNTKDNFEVRFEVIKVFSSLELEKEFLIQEFFKHYNGIISSQRITKMKKNFIQLVKVLEEHDLIESDYKIISDGNYYSTDKLNLDNVSEGFVVYEKLFV